LKVLPPLQFLSGIPIVSEKTLTMLLLDLTSDLESLST
jgi:hypothetical protein